MQEGSIAQAGQSLQEQQRQQQDQTRKKAGLLDLGCGIRCRRLVMVRARMPGMTTVQCMRMRVRMVVAVGNIPCYMEMRRERLHEQQHQHDADDDAALVLFPESHVRYQLHLMMPES